jgi:hypothetical protein
MRDCVIFGRWNLRDQKLKYAFLAHSYNGETIGYISRVKWWLPCDVELPTVSLFIRPETRSV